MVRLTPCHNFFDTLCSLNAHCLSLEIDKTYDKGVKPSPLIVEDSRQLILISCSLDFFLFRQWSILTDQFPFLYNLYWNYHMEHSSASIDNHKQVLNLLLLYLTQYYSNIISNCSHPKYGFFSLQAI